MCIRDSEYIVLGTANLNDVFEYFNKECDSDFVSLNGWLSEKLERIPCVNDTVTYDNLVFTVLKANMRRAIEVKIVKLSEAEEKTE